MQPDVILQQNQQPPFSFTAKDVIIVTHDTGEPQLAKINAVIVMPDVSMSVSYQQQIDSLAAQLPAKDTTTIGETDLLASYLLQRGNI